MRSCHKKFNQYSWRVKKLILVCLFSLLVLPELVIANALSAYTYYQQAESASASGNYPLAIEYYNKAIAQHSKDGELVLDERVTTIYVPHGRTTEKQQTINKVVEPYFPNLRLKELTELMAENYRETHPPKLQLKWIAMEDPLGNNIFDGGESSAIAIEVENVGESAAVNVDLLVNLDDASHLNFSKITNIGTIDAGKSVIKKIKFSADKQIAEKMRQLDFLATEKSGFNSNPLQVFIQSKPHQAEKIIITNLVIEDLSGDSLIEPTEMVNIKATLNNIGKGISSSLVAELELGDNVYLPPDDNGKTVIGKLNPGSNANLQFSFLTNKKFVNNQRIPVAIKISDEQGNKYTMSDPGLTIYIPNKPVVVNVTPRSVNIPLPQENLIDVDLQIPLGTTEKPNAIAVVIGNRNYQKKGLPRVEYAHNDSRIIKEYLVKTLGYDENNVLYYEDATYANFLELFGTESNYQGRLHNIFDDKNTELFIYYSGHGAPDLKTKNSFFVPVDADPGYIALSGYSLDLFYKNVAKIPAKNVTIVLDTCFSGNSDGGYLLSGISPASVNVKVVKPQLSNAVVFSSTQSNQVSVWYHEKRHGLFTYYFLKGLAGAADKDKNLIISSTELGDYVRSSVPYQARRINGFEQNPLLLQVNEQNLVELSKPSLTSYQYADQN